MVNYSLHSMFSELDISFNGRKVNNGTNYPYRSIIEAELNYGSDAKKSHLSAAHYYKDQAGKMDSAGNTGLITRQMMVANSKPVTLYGRLHGDVLNMSRLVKDDVNISFKLTRSKDLFCLISDEKSSYELHILNAKLVVRKVRINHSILRAHALAIEKHPAQYPISNVDVVSHTLTRGIMEVAFDNICPTALPKRVVIGFVDSDSFSGAYSKNPYNFQHYNITEISLAVDNNHVAYSPLTVDFT